MKYNRLFVCAALNFFNEKTPNNTAANTAYTLRLRLALWDIAPFGRNVVYAGTVNRKKTVF